MNEVRKMVTVDDVSRLLAQHKLEQAIGRVTEAQRGVFASEGSPLDLDLFRRAGRVLEDAEAAAKQHGLTVLWQDGEATII